MSINRNEDFKNRPAITLTWIFILTGTLSIVIPDISHGQIIKEVSQVKEADRRFTKGVELFNEGDYDAAMAEFQWAYNLKPHYAVLYNIAACYFKMQRYLESLRYYKRYLKEGGNKIPASRRKEVKEAIHYLKSLMGKVIITTNVTGATVTIDGKNSGKTPMQEPLLVSAGTHLIQIAKAGFVPIREEIAIATGVTIQKHYNLSKDRRVAYLKIKSNAPRSKVFIDNREMGSCPWEGKVIVGEHEIRVQSEGYRDGVKSIILEPDEEREIFIELEIGSRQGKLKVSSDIEGSSVWLEGMKIGTSPIKTLKLPPGIYHISISRKGYKSWEGDVAVREDATTKVEVNMDKVGGKIKPWAFALTTSLSIASIGTASVLGCLTLKKQKEFDEFPSNIEKGIIKPNKWENQQHYNELAKEGKKLAVATDIFISVSAITTVISVFLAFYTEFRPPSSEAKITIGQNSVIGLWRF